MVLSGHTHNNVEFRLGIEYETNENKVRIYHDKYSKYPQKFDEKKPILIQTAACGPHSDYDNFPPYWRMVKIDAENRILSFRHESIEKWSDAGCF
jgi:hypothetical protein